MKYNKNYVDYLYTSGKCYPGKKSEYDDWTRGNVAEAFPDIMTPLSWSLWSDIMNELLRNAFRYYFFSSQIKEKCFIMLREGKLYYNIGLVNHYMKKTGLFSRDTMAGGESADITEHSNYGINRFKFMLHVLGNIRFEKNNKQLEKKSNSKWKEINRFYKRWQKINYNSYDLEKLSRILNSRIKYGKENMNLYTDALTASLSKMAILQWKLNKCGYDDSILLSLVTDIDGIEMAKLNDYIDELKKMVKSTKEKREVIECLKKDNWEHSLIHAGYTTIFEFLYNKILTNYGHRGKNELEIREPCWSENPRMLLNIIIDRWEITNISRKNQYINKILNDKRLNGIIEQARIFTKLRENNKHYLYLIIADIKRIVRVLNHKLYNIVPEMNREDIYFMEYREIVSIIEDVKNFDKIKSKIREREEIYMDFTRSNKNMPIKPESSNGLSGIPACNAAYLLKSGKSVIQDGKKRIIYYDQDLCN